MIKVGIFFGGQSREREVSFAGGRTVYDNLNKEIFEPVPIFVDSFGNFILLNWEFIYKGTIRDFYPPLPHSLVPNSEFQIYVESLGELSESEQLKLIEKIGKKIQPQEFSKLFDIAFLALHGSYGEDGNIQGLLEWYHIPYTGAGILPSALGIDKILQSEVLKNAGFLRPKQKVILRKDWFNLNSNDKSIFLPLELKQVLGSKIVVKSPSQGSSIGVNIIDLEKDTWQDLEKAINKSFFSQATLSSQLNGSVQESISNWKNWSKEEKVQFITEITDIREGIGFPLFIQEVIEPENPEKKVLENKKIFYHPQELYDFLENNNFAHFLLSAPSSEEYVLIEEFIEGREFSCIVIQAEEDLWIDSEKRNIHERKSPLQEISKKAIALPPTEIKKFQSVFDYRSKYLPGMSRKITPIDTSPEKIEEIHKACEKLFETLNCNVYARIDGFLKDNGEIYLNDPNTTSGMLPSSFFFHQAAEIGLSPSSFITYIIRTSLAERIKTGKNNFHLRNLLKDLDEQIKSSQEHQQEKTKVAVIMGGYSTERHISMESGRNIFEKLSSSVKFEPFPVFLTGNDEHYDIYRIPINIMLKDNADDVKEKIMLYENNQLNPEAQKVLQNIISETKSITEKYAGNPIWKPQKLSFKELAQEADTVFIALHGRPGEDGALQRKLDAFNIPYNGSSADSSQITINKYNTNKLLREKGFSVAQHRLIYQVEWEANPDKIINEIESDFQYPLIAKPADDGCSSAVKKINNRATLEAFAKMMFRPMLEFDVEANEVLKLKANEEFPQKNDFLIEELILPKGAKYFMEITGGLLTHSNHNLNGQNSKYEVFQPSETLAVGDVLSLEEKFLAGEGQNITPARFSPNPEENAEVMQKVQKALQEVAETLNIEGYARIDAFVRIFENAEVELIIIEINSLPGMTPATCIFHQSAINGYKPYHFIESILEYAQEKKKLLGTL